MKPPTMKPPKMKPTSNSFLRVLLLLVAVLGLSLVALVVVVLLLGGGRVPEGAVLVVDFDLPLSEGGGAPSPMAAILGQVAQPLAAHEAARALRHAGTDERICAILIRGGASGSLGALDQVRSALRDARAAGKPVYAAPGSADEATLWMGSVADEVWLEPLGGVEFDGWAAEVPYFAEALERYGIDVQVTRVGKYKSAVEPFLLDSMSAENREQLDAVLAAIERKLLGELADARGRDFETLAAWTRERGYFGADEALELGLVDKVAPHHELLDVLRGHGGVDAGEPLAQVSLLDYARSTFEEPDGGPGIAVVVADGEIVDGSSLEGIGGDDLARELRAAREDEDVRAVVLRVDSPGGSATASDVIRSEILALRAAGKPVVVSMGSLAASGGYWISADGDHILAQPETLTGSIGVFGLLPSFQTLAERHGLRTQTVRTSPLAGIQSTWQRKDPAQLALVQAIVDDIYTRFIDLVAAGRDMPREQVEEVAQGRVWTGAQALELGLVDELGGLERAIERARERAGLAKDAPVRFAREEPHWIELLVEEALRGEPGELARGLGEPLEALAPLLQAAEHMSRLERLAGPRRVIARLPFEFALR